MTRSARIAALFVETDGCYFDLPNVDPWDRERDARLYNGPWPVVAHPPCERWGRYWHGSPRKPHQYRLGDDEGCFAFALAAVRRWGGVLEHPAYSHAWRVFNIFAPPASGGWVNADFNGGWTCYVEQAHYGHMARKGTWLYAHGVDLPSLIWGPAEQRLPQIALERYGYEKARRDVYVVLRIQKLILNKPCLPQVPDRLSFTPIDAKIVGDEIEFRLPWIATFAAENIPFRPNGINRLIRPETHVATEASS